MSELIEPLDDAVLVEKRDKLKTLLSSLADYYVDAKDYDQKVGSLLDIYSGGYRQMYSDIFPIIVDIRLEKQKGGLDFLTDNLESVRSYMKEQIQDMVQSLSEAGSRSNDDRIRAEMERLESYRSLYGKVLKLSDHVNLEVQRLDDSERIRADMRETVGGLKNELSKVQNDLKRARGKVRKVQTEMIMILGIFSAIVMAMSGGFTLLGSSIDGASAVGLYKIAFVILLCGIVIFNTIAFLMTYIRRMVADLYEDREHKSKWAQTLVVAVSNNRFIIAFNLMMIVMLAIDLWCWANSNSPMA